MSKPLISVVLPVYNVEPYLDKCMNTVLNQTYPNMEIILVDDGSTDHSGKFCDHYAQMDSRVHVIHKKNGGLSDARNVGMACASGEYIAFIDSDDTVALDMIDYLYGLIQRFHTSMSLCCHNVVFDNGEKVKPLGDGAEKVLDSQQAIEDMLYHHLVDTSAWAKLYKRDLFKNISYPKGKLFEDIGTTYKLFLKAKQIACGFVPKYNYQVREGSIVTRSFSRKKLDLLEMTDTMGRDVLAVYPDLGKAVLRRRVYARFSTLNQMLDVDIPERKEIIRFIKKYRWDILKDPKAPKRDKIAIICLALGFGFYSRIWRFHKN